MSANQRAFVKIMPKRTLECRRRLELALGYDMSFYCFKNGKLNVSRLARCAGLSYGFLRRELWKRGLV